MIRKKKTLQVVFWPAELRWATSGPKVLTHCLICNERYLDNMLSRVLSEVHGYNLLGFRPWLCPLFRFGRSSPATSAPFQAPVFPPSKPNGEVPLRRHRDSLKHDGRERQKFSLIPVDMWLCLALWILLSVWISSCVFFTEMTVFLFRWQAPQDRIDRSLKAADEKQH